jgi:DNA-binding beta-propeller fold protein YncE
MRKIFVVLAALLASGAALAADAVKKDQSILDRLYSNTGVYHRPASAHTPNFVSDPGWPAPLPHGWLLGQIGGLYVDQNDHIWVYNRPRTMTNDEAASEVRGGGNGKNGLGFARPNGPAADCCNAAPSVLEFDTAGKLLKSWGGPADPGWLESHCKAAEGCIWPNSEHGIYVDHKGNVWLAGNGVKPVDPASSWTTHKDGGDGFVLKFDQNGNFKMRIGGTPTAPASNDTNGGFNGSPLLYLPADMVVDPKTNRLYIADGYGNRRIVVVDADAGKYVGHFGAYGSNPIDDAGAAAGGRWVDDRLKGNKKPAFFRNPVHCVKIAEDGKLYVCDRGNDRIQVFDSRDPNLGKPCVNLEGAAGKCGYLAEQAISANTETVPAMPGTSVSLNFSRDAAQSCLYVGDNSNMTIYVLSRSNLSELGRLGRSGRNAGQFHWLHQVSLDKAGNIYTAEVDTGKRIQKFVRYGAAGCSGTGAATVGGPAE